MSGGQIVQALNRWAGVLAALAVLGNLVTGFALAQGWQANAPAARLAKLEAFADSSRADRTALHREDEKRKTIEEAISRYLCLQDFDKARLAGIPCRDLGVTP